MQTRKHNIFANNKIYMIILILIIFLGFYLRMIGLDKPEGLWFDELYSYFVAKDSFPFGILGKIYDDATMNPCYFFILHTWMNLFGNDDLLLRFSSVILGILTIPVTYITGKELDSRKTGIIAALLVSINSLLIYYSQEVRMYALMQILGILSILFIIKIRKSSDKKNYLGLILTNTAFLYTSYLACIFVFFQACIFSLYLFLKDKKKLKYFIYSQVITLILFLPYLPFLLHFQDSFTMSFLEDYSNFNFSHILSVIQSWFSPILTSLYTPSNDYLSLSVLTSQFFILFILIPVIINIMAIFKAVIKEKFTGIIFLMVFLVILVEIVNATRGKFLFVSRYTVAFLPIILLISAYGLSNIKNKVLTYFLVGFLVVSNIFYIIHFPFSAPKFPRAEGLKIVSDTLNQLPLNKRDFIIMPYGGNLLGKYYNKAQVLKFDIFKVIKNKQDPYIYNPGLIEVLEKVKTKDQAYNILKDYLDTKQPAKSFTNHIEKELTGKISSGRYLILVIAPLLNSYNYRQLENITADNKAYKNIPIFHLLKSKVLNDLYSIINKDFVFEKRMTKIRWQIIVLRKK